MRSGTPRSSRTTAGSMMLITPTRRDALGTAGERAHDRGLHDAHPPPAEAFRARREPQVLHRETRAVDVSLRHREATEHVLTRTLGVARHEQVERRIEDAL